MSRDFPLREKLAAALAIIADIPWNHRRKLQADQIIGLFNFDHDPIPHAGPFNGPPVHWNCTPRLIKDHREKTAKDDVPMIARVRRVAPKAEEFRRRMLAKAGQGEAPPKPKSRMKSRGFQGHRKFNGEIVWKEKRR